MAPRLHVSEPVQALPALSAASRQRTVSPHRNQTLPPPSPPYYRGMAIVRPRHSAIFSQAFQQFSREQDRRLLTERPAMPYAPPTAAWPSTVYTTSTGCLCNGN
ncbi:hypothetical protein AAFF_G00349830 [Aldrovandia affinis]|uniref:Uncharacterized protein n=1 Tax=Aldrovandia affinis TaxID=143900 RepID=A0AAD7SKC9_9TELE|nr:hypothetical protein AAFF_G00349830 [Aldrovandia affinis]